MTCKNPSCVYDDDSVSGYCSLFCKWTDEIGPRHRGGVIIPTTDEPPTEARRIAEELARDFANDNGYMMPHDSQASRRSIRGGARVVSRQFAEHMSGLLAHLLIPVTPHDDSFLVHDLKTVSFNGPQVYLGIDNDGLYVNINGHQMGMGDTVAVRLPNGQVTNYTVTCDGQRQGGVYHVQITMS